MTNSILIVYSILTCNSDTFDTAYKIEKDIEEVKKRAVSKFDTARFKFIPFISSPLV